MKTICIRAQVFGKVQGVFYRDNTRRKAKKLGITGWVKNNRDGSVELHACGDSEKIKSLIAWLQEGPPNASVTEVVWSEILDEKYETFIIAR